MADRGASASLVLRHTVVVLCLAAGAVVALIVALGEGTGGSSGTTASLLPAESGAPPVTSPLPDSVTIAATGEILPHPSVVDFAAGYGIAQSYDFAPLFADLRRSLRKADLAICHLEVPVAPDGVPLSGYPEFAVPREIGDGIRQSGWDRCSTASNHSNDKGTAGITATLTALDGARVGHSGMARTAEEAGRIPMADANGVPVAHLSYTWGFNGVPPEQKWMTNVIDRAKIQKDARRARRAGAEIVVVSLHWGNEYDSAGSPDQRALAQQLLASPNVDLIVGHGPHVIQPIEKYHGKYALLSVGNLIANQGTTHPSTYDGMIATITFNRTEDGTYRAAKPVVEPTWYDNSAGRVRLINQGAAPSDPEWIGSHLESSGERTRGILGGFVARP